MKRRAKVFSMVAIMFLVLQFAAPNLGLLAESYAGSDPSDLATEEITTTEVNEPDADEEVKKKKPVKQEPKERVKQEASKKVEQEKPTAEPSGGNVNKDNAGSGEKAEEKESDLDVDEEETREEDLSKISPMAIGTPGYYTTDPNAIVVPTQLKGQSTNVHTKPHMLWANGDKVYVAVKATHTLQYMTLNGVNNVGSEVYDPWISIFVDGTEYKPDDLTGNKKDSHWTVFEFNLADLNLDDDGEYPFFVKGIGGGHDVGGHLLFEIPKTDVKAKKVWVGGTERPAVTLQLMAQVGNGEKKVLRTGEVDGTETPAWTYTWTEVPQYDPYGRAYTFTADEETVPVNYEKSIDGLTVTNTYNPKTIDIAINKEWIGPEAESVTIKLFANGEDTGQTLELYKENNWSGSFTGLNKYDDKTGDPITYTVEEVSIPGYSTEKSGSVEDGFTFTNINDETIDIPVEKKWIGSAADSVTIKLFADGDEVEELVLNANNKWSGQFKDLRKYDAETGEDIVYTMEEVETPGYTTKKSGSVEDGFTFTNINDATVKVDVQKKWIGPEADSVTIKLLANGVDTGKTLELTAETDWKGTFDNLRKYDEESGEEIAYSVEEVAIPGYSSETTGSAEDGFIITNTNDATVDVDVEKKWVGALGGPVTIKLLANDEDSGKTLILNEDNDWKDSFKNLRKYDATTGEAITYTVEEVDVPENYDVSISEENGKFIVTNTARYGSLTVEKVDEEGQPLAGATFELRDAEGNVVGTFYDRFGWDN